MTEHDKQAAPEPVPQRTAPPVPPPEPPAPSQTPLPDSPQSRPEPAFERLNRRALLVLLLLLAAAAVPMLRLFIAPLVVAFTVAALFYPFYRWVATRLGRKRDGLASFVTCMVLLLGLLIPTYVVGHLVTAQTVELYNNAGPKIREVIRKGNEGPLSKVRDQPVFRWLRLHDIDLQGPLQEIAKATGKGASFVVNKTSVGILTVAANLFVVFFTLFYLFRDGRAMLNRLRYLSPLRNEYEDMLFERFMLISRASLRGTVLIGVIQGTLGGLTFLVFGIKTWLLWGFVMVVMSIIPFTGAWFVMVPAGIIQIVVGNVFQGVSIIVICIAVVSTIDNLLRPRLVGTEARMHDLLIFFSTLGGISVFGVLGFIVGPVIAALLVTVLEIYAMEYQPQLSSSPTLPGTKN